MRLRPWLPSSTPSWVSTFPLSQGLAHSLPLPALKIPRALPDTQQLSCPLSQQGAQPPCRADTLLLPLASPCSSRCAGRPPLLLRLSLPWCPGRGLSVTQNFPHWLLGLPR